MKKRGCGPTFFVVLLLWMVFFLVCCPGKATGAVEESTGAVAEQVIRALVEAADGNEMPVDISVEQLVYPVDVSGIDHLAGLDTEMLLVVDKSRWTAEEAQMLVTLAMAEAEGEDTVGKALVILVVLNRVESDSFPDTIEGVIFQKDQFSPVTPGHRYFTVEPNADCWAALEMVESGWDESQGALYFERNTEKSTWHSRNLVELFDHGKHIFYAEEDIAK